MSILHINGSFSNVTASGLVWLYEGLGRHNGCSTENIGLGRHNMVVMQKIAFPHKSEWNSFNLEDMI